MTETYPLASGISAQEEEESRISLQPVALPLTQHTGTEDSQSSTLLLHF